MKNYRTSLQTDYQFPQALKLYTELYTAVYTSNTNVVPFIHLVS